MLVKAVIIMVRLGEKERIKPSRGRGILTIGKKKAMHNFEHGKDDRHSEGISAHLPPLECAETDLILLSDSYP